MAKVSAVELLITPGRCGETKEKYKRASKYESQRTCKRKRYIASHTLKSNERLRMLMWPLLCEFKQPKRAFTIWVRKRSIIQMHWMSLYGTQKEQYDGTYSTSPSACSFHILIEVFYKIYYKIFITHLSKSTPT